MQSISELVLSEVLQDCESHLVEPKSDQWHALRRVGASDAGAIMGQDEYKDARKVWAVLAGKEEPFKGNFFTERGALYEPLIREYFQDYFSENYGVDIEVFDGTGVSLVSTQAEYMTCNLDGLIRHPTRGWEVLEIKKRTSKSLRHYEGNSLKSSEWWQIQHQLFVTGLKRGHLFAEVGDEYIHRVVDRDDEAILQLVENAGIVWNSAKSGIWDNTIPASTYESLLKTSPEDNGEIVSIESIAPVLAIYSAKKDEFDRLESELAELKKEICEHIGTNKGVRAGSFLATWSTRKGTTRLDAKALQTAYPEIYAMYSKTGEPTRVFSVKKG